LAGNGTIFRLECRGQLPDPAFLHFYCGSYFCVDITYLAGLRASVSPYFKLWPRGKKSSLTFARSHISPPKTPSARTHEAKRLDIMNKLDKKTLDVSRGFTYTYYTSPAKIGRQTVLLVHGFPSITEEWAEVISDHLLPNGYGALVIDCLGYAGSSKPTDLNAYNLQYIAQDIKEICDKESLDKVVSLGHDWVSISCPLKPTSHFYLRDMNFA